MPGRLFLSVVLAIVPFVDGCAQIKTYSVSPSTACPGEPVEVKWQACGQVTLDAVPPLDGTGPQKAEGATSFSLPQSTRFVLKAHGLFKDDQREWDVKVIPAQQSMLFGGLAQCDPTARFAVTSFLVQEQNSSRRAHAASIKNNYRRSLVVSKEGTEVEIPPGGTTDRFKETTILGSWTIQAPVGSEACATVLGEVANRLTIAVDLACGE
jgi:hypothetical protein